MKRDVSGMAITSGATDPKPRRLARGFEPAKRERRNVTFSYENSDESPRRKVRLVF